MTSRYSRGDAVSPITWGVRNSASRRASSCQPRCRGCCSSPDYWSVSSKRVAHKAQAGIVALVFDTGEPPSPAPEADPARLAQTHPVQGAIGAAGQRLRQHGIQVVGNPACSSSLSRHRAARIVAVDEGISPLASASKPDLPLSLHPAPQSPDPLAWTAPLARSLERPPFTAPTRVSSHPLGSLRRLRASPPLLATRPFRRPSPRQRIWGITPGLCFLGNPTHVVIRLAPALTSKQRGLLRSLPSFDAPVGPHYLPGFAGVNLGHSRICPAPSLVLLDPADTPRRLVYGDDSSNVCSLPAHRCLLPGMPRWSRGGPGFLPASQS